MALAVCGSTTDPRGRETIQHGTALFPIAFYEDDLHTYFVPWHWHEEFECIVAVEGQMEVRLEGTHLRLKPGEGIFINSGALHAVEAVDKQPSVLRSIVFHPKLIGGSMDSVFWQRLVQPLLREEAPRYLLLDPAVPWQRELAAEILTIWQAGTEAEEDCENFIRYRLSAVFRRLNAHSVPVSRRKSQQEHISEERMKTMLRFIGEHYPEDLTLEDIAGSVSVSGSVCLRCFRQVLGTTPIQYLKQLRIEKAAQLLLTTDQKIQQIGLQCGFSDLSYFTKTFREEKGCPPKEYRETFAKEAV